MTKPVLLTLAGRKRTASAWTGGAVVQLGSDGTWVELAAGDTVAWNLKNFECTDGHVMFHIRSAGFGSLYTPDRGQLYRSVDQGATWADVTPSSGNVEYVSDVAMDADDNFWCVTSELAAKDATPGPTEVCRIYKSADYGETWTLSHLVTEVSFPGANERPWPLFSITCHPTDANIIIAEGTEMVGHGVRLWRTTDGGANWSTLSSSDGTIVWESPPGQAGANPTYGVFNTGGQLQHVFDYTLEGDLVYAGILELSNDNYWVLKSLDDGSTFNVYHEVGGGLTANAYGAVFQESTLVYVLSRHNLMQSAAPVGPGQLTEIGLDTDAPWSSTNYIFHGLSRHAVGGVDTLHVGVHLVGPGAGATADPSVWTRPADLGSGWVQHPSFATMDSDLGYRLYVAIDGVVGATEFEPDVPRPRPPDEPPGGGPGGEPGMGEPGEGEPGVGEPGVGPARRAKTDLARAGRRQRRGRADIAQPRRRQPLMITDRIDKSQTPQTAAEPVARRWMAFGWLARAVAEGHKTMTLRDWDPVEGAQWAQGELFYAYDRPPSEGGSRLALLRVAAQPYRGPTSELGKADFLKLGYGWAQATQAAPPSGRAVEEMWADMQSRPQTLWVVRFAVERLYDQRAPERGSVKVAV